MKTYRVSLRITLRQSILDPQGNATQRALTSIGFQKVSRVRIGRFIELDVETDSADEARRVAARACDKLLANPVMDDYQIVGVEEAAVAV